jgi:hypothetical protein
MDSDELDEDMSCSDDSGSEEEQQPQMMMMEVRSLYI